MLEPPKHLPNHFSFNFARPWMVLRPRVYRFLPSQFVNAFFEDGSLRLSSFQMFKQHEDEARKDPNEGFGIRVGVGENMTIYTVQGKGSDVYVLCGCMNHNPATQKEFGDCDGCFVIDDTLNFASCISNHIGNFKGGMEGSVIYQDEPTILKNIGNITADEYLEKYRRADGTIDMQMVKDVMGSLGGVEEFFVKNSKYASQNEYRIIWATHDPIHDFIDIKVPEARQYCRRIS